jgi:hypothetical protein
MFQCHQRPLMPGRWFVGLSASANRPRQHRHATPGAVIGGTAGPVGGAVVGGVIGHEVDPKQDKDKP